MKTYITPHYIFTYEEGSLAEKDIKMIADVQEKSFNKICETLKVDFPEKIKYYLLDSKEEVGKLYGDDTPINGFAVWGENKVYAVYNNDTKCIGPHEDAHLISFIINAPISDFIVEGLAMYFDEKWWEQANNTWASYYKNNDDNISIFKLFDNNEFFKYNCELTYPIAGSFTKFLIETFGISKYLELYKIKTEIKKEDFENIFNLTPLEIETMYWNKIKEIPFNSEIFEKLLNDNK